MTNFFFKVKNKENKVKQGTLIASSLADAAGKLEQSGYIVLEIKEQNNNNVSTNYSNIEASGDIILSIREKKDFFNSFSTMYKSGLPIVRVFDSIYNSSKNTKIKSLCSKILQGIQKGLSLKEAMKSCTNAIGSAYTMLVIAGEESGQLIEVLSNINKNN